MLKTTPEILKELRKERNLTQGDIAKILGFSTTAYQNYERGINEPSNKSLCILAEFYGVTTDYLLGRDPNPFSAINVDIIGTDDEAFSAAYKNLPDYAKLIFMDALKKLAEAGSRERENELTLSTECSEPEDAAREKDDISVG